MAYPFPTTTVATASYDQLVLVNNNVDALEGLTQTLVDFFTPGSSDSIPERIYAIVDGTVGSIGPINVV